MRSTSEAASALGAGWRRVLSAPGLVGGVWLITTVAALPSALAVRSAIAEHLGSSLVARGVASGMDQGWWQEFLMQSRGEATTLSTAVIGAAAPVANWSRFVDGLAVPAPLMAAVAASLLLWIFLTGGLVDRLARARRVGTRHFFGTCGVFFFRFLRLTLLAGVVYWFIASPFHYVLFDGVYVWLTRDTSAERVAFAWRVICYVFWLAPLVLVNIVVDYAKVRAVVEDRRSMLSAILAASRFLRKHALSAALLFVSNALILAIGFAVYLLTAPGARGGDWRLLAVLAIGQGWILMRIVTRLAFLSTATALVQQSFAHADYAATPPPIWPESPAAEAIENAARFGTRPSS
jgi:hypothetical protein